jgi:hypothetical protein
MNKRYRFPAATLVALLLAVAPASRCMADEKPTAAAPGNQINAVAALHGFRLNVHLDNTYVIDALGEISRKGNIQVIVRGTVHPKVKVWNINMVDVRPEDAIEKICAAAKLTWQVHNKIYVIGKTSPADASKTASAALKQSKTTISLEYKDSSTAAILAAIGEQAGIHVVLGSTIIEGEKINYIHLKDVTPEDALREISHAFDFEWKELNTNTYIITKQERAVS